MKPPSTSHAALFQEQQPHLSALASAIAVRWSRYQQARRHRATARLLDSLSNRTLKDIGIDRSEIGSLAARPHERWRRC
jgi:uncharacterized protein YjiS (DUF1127 family)